MTRDWISPASTRRSAKPKYAGQVLSDAAERFWDNADFELTVTEENGLILFNMRVLGTEAPAIRAERTRD